jgi:hypothetical protein
LACRRERSALLMADSKPRYAFVAPNCIRKGIERVPDHAKYLIDAKLR